MSYLLPRLLVLSIGLLSACCSEPSGPFAALGPSPTLTVHIENWNLGQDHSVGISFGPEPAARTDVRTGIDANGDFTITLPDEKTVNPFFNTLPYYPPSDCVKVCPSELKILTTKFYVYHNDTVIGSLYYMARESNSNASQSAYYVYASQLGSWTGVCNARGTNSGNHREYKDSFQEGWNTVLGEFGPNPIYTSYEEQTAPPLENLKWTFISNQP